MKARASFIVASAVLLSALWPSPAAWAQRPPRGGAPGGTAKDNAPGGAQDKAQGNTPKEFQNEPSYKVVKIVNGGTLVASIEMQPATVRLLGIRYGEAESTKALSDLLKGKEIYLQFEPNAPKQDGNGAFLAYVYRAPDGLLLNQEMVAKGFAGVAPGANFSKQDAFQAAEKKAQDQKLGLWAGFGGANAKKAAAKATDKAEKAAEKGGADAAKGGADAAKDEPAADDEPEKVFILKTSKRYHREGCRLLTKTATAVDLADVKGKYTPCPVCKPDKPAATAAAAKEKSADAPKTSFSRPKKRKYASQAEKRQMLNQVDPFGGIDPSGGGGGGGLGPPY